MRSMEGTAKFSRLARAAARSVRRFLPHTALLALGFAIALHLIGSVEEAQTVGNAAYFLAALAVVAGNPSEKPRED